MTTVEISAQANPFMRAIHRQHDTITRFNVAAFRAQQTIDLLQRMELKVPLHEWAEAKRRGNTAVYLLLEAYIPQNAGFMRAEGKTPRCPPWATRRYRDACK